MRPTLLTLAALLALAPLAIAIPAHASTLDDFTLTGNGSTIDFALPATQTFLNHPHVVYLGYTAPGTVNGVAGYTIDATFFAPAFTFVGTAQIFYSPLNMNPPSNPFYGASPIGVTYNPALPTDPNPYGTLTNTFVPGSYDLFTSDFMTGVRTPYTLTITPETSVTPEPATLALLATGSLGFVAALRRRQIARLSQ